MRSELHDRLEYLVNYSSQLIFVSGDSIAQQQRTLESFVFEQHDDTEIAYVTASQNMEISDYRRQLCRQLLNQQVGSFVRPLNELLASLNQHDGPILIAVTNAQHMPDKLLQELWDLVLQSRFAGNKQHLNVLLFGESQWAEKAKQWLPAKNTQTPLLISSQSVLSDHAGSDLDRLIASRREAFQAHLDKRAMVSREPGVNRLSSPWFIAGVVILFLALFAAIVGWQYRDTLQGLFSPLTPQAEKGDSPNVAAGSAFDTLTNTPTAAPAPPVVREYEIVDTSELPAQESDDERRVTDWQDAVTKLDKPATAQPASEDEATLSVQADVAVTEEPVISQTQANVPPVAEPEATAEAAEAQKQADTPMINGIALHNQELQDTLTDDDYIIQLSGLQDPQLLADFVNDNQLANDVKVYRTYRYGGDWYVVLYQKTYSSLDEARAGVAALPDFPEKGQAFVKRGNQVRLELSRSAPPQQNP